MTDSSPDGRPWPNDDTMASMHDRRRNFGEKLDATSLDIEGLIEGLLNITDGLRKRIEALERNPRER